MNIESNEKAWLMRVVERLLASPDSAEHDDRERYLAFGRKDRSSRVLRCASDGARGQIATGHEAPVSNPDRRHPAQQ